MTSIRLEVAGGRIVCPGLSNAASRSLSAEKGGSEEALTINPASDDLSLKYCWQDAERRFALELLGDGSVTLRDQQAAETVVLEQNPQQDLELTLEQTGAPKQEWRAKTLWHLLVLHPEARSCLLPRFSLLAPHLHLAGQLLEIEEHLAQEADPSWRQQRSAWNTCVEELGNSDYKSRTAADQQLRAGGPAAAAYLQSLDLAALQHEQRQRVERIVAHAAQQLDTPATVANAWCYDRQIWCARLHHDDPQIRQRAAAHLTDLVDRPLTYDPQADSATRNRQARVLEKTLLRR